MMKRYHEESNRWMKEKALEFFSNFIRNHKGVIDDNDTFELIARLETHTKFVMRVKTSFSGKKLQELQNRDDRASRLIFDDESKEILRKLWNDPSTHPTLRKMFADMIAGYRKKRKSAACSRELFPQKVQELQKTFDLSDFETDILLVLLSVRSGMLKLPEGEQYSLSSEERKVSFVAKCLDRDRGSVLCALGNTGKLRRYMCVDNDLDFNSEIYGYLNGINSEPLASHYFKQWKDIPLPWDFYGDLSGKHGRILKQILSAGKGKSGVNILLYGAPGTGKTSFAQTLAHELGLRCYFINQASGNRQILFAPENRFGALQLCDDQVDPAKSLIVVDEADNMLQGISMGGFSALLNISSPSCGDKGMLNNVLDTLKTPTIWITNTPAEAVDESSRRRFDYSIRFLPLSHHQRLAIWKNNVSKMNLHHLFEEDLLKKLAERYALSAGGITLALRNIAKIAPAKSEVPGLVEQLLNPHCELLGIPVADSRFAPAGDYSLKGLTIKGDIPLERMIRAVQNFQTNPEGDHDRPRMNLLLSGPPGSGKTEFVKYLSQKLNTKLIIRMGSDILSKYVGEIEQNIRQAFADANAEHAILFLDEIDGLVQSRELAQRSWEVSKVNELLYQMEHFSGVMIGATNFASSLDAAILRRFTFKVEFDFLSESGKVLFFEHMFQTSLSDAEKKRLTEIPCLAPGDFRTVRQSLFYLGGETSNAERLFALEQESRAKTQNRFARRQKIGF